MQTQLLTAVHEVNERQKDVVPSKVLQHFGPALSGKRIAVWGLAFRAGTDEIREAPALTLIETLLVAGAEVSAHDPQAIENARKVYGDRIEFVKNKWDATQNADALVVMTAWDEYTGVDVGTLRWHMKEALVFGSLNCMSKEELADASFRHYGIGQGRRATQPAFAHRAAKTISDHSIATATANQV